MSKKDKKLKEQQLMMTRQKEEVLSHALKFSRKRFKRFDEVIVQLYRGEDLRSFYIDERIMKIGDCFSKISSAHRVLLKDVFVYLEKNSLLISDEDHIQAVLNMVKSRTFWKKSIFAWRPVSKRISCQLKELAFHLFCRYDVPEFLYKAFFEKKNTEFIEWFIHIGTGKRIRDLPVPIPFTQKTGHYFLQAPSKFSIAEALRWAQVKGMNGNDKLAERIAYSWIGAKTYCQEDFWETFIRLLVNSGMFDHDKITEVIDYVRETKRENSDYTLKGRTMQSLTRQSDEWHKRATLTKGGILWNPCGIYRYKAEKKDEIVKIEELTGSKLLVEEGRRMKHCVGTYVHQCMTGKTAIFSLRKYTMGVLAETLATIEVNLVSKRIVQAKGKLNRKISDESRKHLDQWAHKNDLSVSPFL